MVWRGGIGPEVIGCEGFAPRLVPTSSCLHLPRVCDQSCPGTSRAFALRAGHPGGQQQLSNIVLLPRLPRCILVRDLLPNQLGVFPGGRLGHIWSRVDHVELCPIVSFK